MSAPLRVVVAGGGAMGAAASAFLSHLAQLQGVHTHITNVEMDSAYRFASSPRSVGGIRQQFSNIENVLLSLHSASDLNRDIDVNFRPSRYLFLATQSGEAVLRANAVTQTSAGAAIRLLSAKDTADVCPWIRTDDIVCGAMGGDTEGQFDPWLLLSHFRQQATARGVVFVPGVVAGARVQGRKVTHVRVLAHGHVGAQELPCDVLINAAGAWSSVIAAMAGIEDFPVFPRKRVVFGFRSPASASRIRLAPLVVDPLTGAYFRHEGAEYSGTYIGGVSPAPVNDPDADGGRSAIAALANRCDAATDFADVAARVLSVCERELAVTADDHALLWESVVWPALAHRVPAFEDARQTHAWAGYYDFNTWDANAMIGRHVDCDNMIFATGFSGHGIQQSPAVGRAIAELVMHEPAPTIDVSRLRPDRYKFAAKVEEQNIV